MFIPQGDWIVVVRNVKETSRGDIIKAGMTEKGAKEYVKRMSDKNTNRTVDMWAMHKDDY